jgi:hypothetical protein
LAQNNTNEYAAKNQEVFREIPLKSNKTLTISRPKTNSLEGWQMKVNGSEVTEKDLMDLDPEELSQIFQTPGLIKNTALKQVAQNIKDNKFYKDSNGKRYLTKTSDEAPPPPLQGNDPLKTEIIAGSKTYQFMTLNNLPNKPLMAKDGVPPRLNEPLQKALNKLPPELDRQLTGSLRVSSGHRSIEDNVMAYRTNMSALTNSDHFYGDAIDISTVALETTQNTSFDGSGYEFLDWLGTSQGESWMKENNVWVWHHTVTGESGWHIHMEYNTGKTGLKNDNKKYEENRKQKKLDLQYGK